MNRPIKPQLIDVKADIRERLLHVAIRLFAEKGINAVSMRAINTAAGSKNKSAVHYHFGNKLGIVEAIFNMLQEQLFPSFEDLLERIEARTEKEDVSVPEILMTFYFPFFIINSIEGYGPYVIKLLAKMMLDSTPEYQKMFNEHFHQYITRIYALIKNKLPHKDERHLKFQLIHSSMATITGIATIEIMDSTPLGDIRFNSEIEMLFSYVDYVNGGLTNNESCMSKIDFNFWQNYFQDKKLSMLRS